MTTQIPQKSRFRRWLVKAAYILGVLLVLAVAGELTARFLGHRPWKETVQTISITPAGSFYAADSSLGYRGMPGKFKLLLQDRLSFDVTHDAAGWRITSVMPLPDSLPEIWILGCSFTHGYGVNNLETYPAQLQRRMPGYRVRNLGMDAYGTLQNWLTLQQLLTEGKKPAAVVLAYGGFHAQRNTANRYWRKALHGQQIAEGLRYPYIRLDKNDSLVVHYERLTYHPLPLQRHFALPSLIEENWNRNEEEGLRSDFVTQILIQRIADASHAAGAHFVLAGIHKHPDTEKVLRIFRLDRLHTVDISQDLDNPLLRILPDNGHPNALAHEQMAEKLHSYLMEKVLQ